MYVVLFAAQSLDGRITRHELAGDAFSSPADKQHIRAEIRACDACVMGRATYTQSKSRLRPDALPGLRRVVWTRQPDNYHAETIPGVLEFTDEAPAATAARLRADGRKRCAILGGSETNTAWLSANLIDEVCLTVESRIFGRGTPLVTSDVALDPALELIEAKILETGGPVRLRYRVIK